MFRIQESKKENCENIFINLVKQSRYLSIYLFNKKENEFIKPKL